MKYAHLIIITWQKPDTPSQVQTENLLERGAALLDLKAYEDSQLCLEDVLKMLPMVLGQLAAQKDPRMAACHNHLAAVFHFYEEYDEALVEYKAAQGVYASAGMDCSLEMANVFNNLATLYDDMVSKQSPLLTL